MPVQSQPAPLVDPFQRAISYLRVSVTDRCDFPLHLLHVRAHDLLAEEGTSDPGGT
jgi:GTP 3',8-cyclase